MTVQSTMTERMIGAAKLDVDIYDEVEHDETATSQAAGVVAMVAVAQAVGGFVRVVVGLWVLVAGFVGLRQALDLGNLKTFLTVFLGWLALAIPMALLARLGA